MEIKREPHGFIDGEGNEFIIFDQDHTHGDILRYVVNDLDAEEVRQLIDQIEAEGAAGIDIGGAVEGDGDDGRER